MKTPKVSVIIPVYNTAKYLSDSIGSVMNQTLLDIEIIIVNDGSTDSSYEVISNMASLDVRIQVYNQRNQGQSVARNEGFKHASGEYIYFMDSDDVLLPNALEVLYKRCHSKQLDVLFFDADTIYEDGQSSLSWDYHRTSRYDENTLYQGLLLMYDMLQYCTYRAVPWLYIVSKDCLIQKRLTFYPGIIHEDELFTVLLFIQSDRISCLKESLVNHRIRAHSTMTTKYSIRNVSCYLTVIDELFVYARSNNAVLPLIRKYVNYTLCGVYETAFLLPFFDKCKVYYRCYKSGYLRYVSLIKQIKFWLKNQYM